MSMVKRMAMVWVLVLACFLPVRVQAGVGKAADVSEAGESLAGVSGEKAGAGESPAGVSGEKAGAGESLAGVSGAGGFEAVLAKKAKSAKLAAPGFKSAEAKSWSKVALSWSKVSGASGYRIYRGEGGGKLVKLADVKKSARSYEDKTAEPGIEYTYKVAAYRKSGGKITVGKRSKALTVTTTLKTPKLIKVSGSASAVTVEWKKVSGAQGYVIYRKNGGSFQKLAAVTGAKTLTYRDESAKPGVPYTYTVRARRKVNGKWVTGERDKKGLAAKRKISRVKLVSAVSSGGKQVDLTWKMVDDVTGYQVFRQEKGQWTQIATVKGKKKVTLSDTGLTVGSKYTYTVRAYTKAEGKVYTGSYDKNGLSVRVIPATPKIRSLEYVDSQSVEVTWKKAKGAAGYRVYRRDGSGKWKELADVTDGSLSYVDKKAAVGSRHTYRVRAYALSKNRKTRYMSLYSGTKSVLASRGIDVSKWNDVDFAAVKKSGISFVMLRIGHGNEKDIKFDEFIGAARAQKLKVGVYYYTCADDVNEAKEELSYLLTLLAPYKKMLDYPVAVDFEEPSRAKAELKEENTAIVKTFCKGLQKEGYDTLVYSNAEYFSLYLDYPSLKPYGIWLARWYEDEKKSYDGEEDDVIIYDFGHVDMWQHDAPGRPDSEALYDMDIGYVEY